MRKHLPAAIALLGVISGLFGIASFFGAKGTPIAKFFAGNPLPLVLPVVLIAVGWFLYLNSKYKRDLLAMKRKLDSSQQNVRALLDTLYSDARFSLVRYEGEMLVRNAEGDCDLRKTYVLTAPHPETEMTCYVEAREDDDLDRIFNELKQTCSGGRVKPGYRRLYSDDEHVILVGFVVEFTPPVSTKEHTLYMSCGLKGYFAKEHFDEFVHMALPTHRSVLKFSFDYDVVISNESTTLLNGLASESVELNGQNFSRPTHNSIKWEINEPKFGSFYQVSFDVLKKAHQP